MSNQPNQSNQSSNFFTNTKILEFFSSNVWFLNVLTVLLGIILPASVLLNLKLLFFPTQIDSNSICPSFKEDLKKLLSLSDTSSITDSHIDTSSPPNILNHTLMTCSYKISDSETNSDERGKTYQYLIVNYLSPLSTLKMAEVPIKRENIEAYCNDPKNIRLPNAKLVLEPVKPDVQVYPVFRWKCRVSNETHSSNDLKSPGVTTHPLDSSIGFDEHGVCAKYTPPNKSYVLRYRYYYDPDSLYCVDPNFGNIP